MSLVRDRTPNKMEADRTPALEAVVEWLDSRHVSYDVVEHPETFAAVDEARATGVDPNAMAKTLALHDRPGYRLAVIPASRQLDLARAREALGASSHLRLATEAEMARDFSSFEVGALPPLGPMLPAPEVVDVHLLYVDRLLCAAGDHRHALAVDPRDLLRVVEPRVADICQHRDSTHDTDFSDLPRV
jgi:Ala-tRNA(Pro) deacylase